MCTDILSAFHSTRYTMLKFSTLPLHTNSLRAPLTKLSRDNMYSYCAHTNQTPMHSANTVHTMHTIIMCVHTTHNLLCVFTSRTSITHASLNPHCAMLNLVRTPIFFCAMPKFSAHTHTPKFFHVTPKFSAHTRTPTFFCAVPKFSAHTHTPTFFSCGTKF
jgi:hypothetical protein